MILRTSALGLSIALAMPDARVEAASRLAVYLRSPKTQAWLRTYGRGKLDDRPPFFPVTVQATP